ncbi:MAG: putative PolB exonuclease-like 3'-5' exonuclease [Cocleimonas sp.]|jgi:predicted PolB exonuclease-like 3'-5' exonuclease
MNVLVFNIETIPDIDGGQLINSLQGLDDKSTAKALFHLRKQQSGDSDLPLYLQRIASISVVYRGMGDDMGHEVTVRSLGDENSSEAELLSLFFNEIENQTPTLVSWNGSSFDLPVVHYRALKNKVSAPAYWEKGNNNNDFSDDNYLSRYHDRHTGLMDVLSSYNESAGAPLNDIALMLGFPGKKIMDTAQIWKEFLQGNINTIRSYGEIGVLNNYLVYLRFQLICGEISEEELTQEFLLLREKLDKSEQTHLQEFSVTWEQ